MKKKIIFLSSIGILSVSIFGITLASWSVSDDAPQFGVKVSVLQTDHYYYQNGSGEQQLMTKSSGTLPEGYTAQYEIDVDVNRGDTLSFYKSTNKITENIATGGTTNNVRGSNENIIVRSSQDDSTVYLRVKTDSTYDVWASDYATEYSRIFLNGGGSSLWNQGGAEFYIHSWIDGTEFVNDYSLTQVGTGDIYYADIDAEHNKSIFLREKPGTGKVVWTSEEGLWNKTANLNIPTDGKDTYTITGWGESDGSWSKHECVAGTPTQQVITSPTCTEPGSYYEITNCIYCEKELSRQEKVSPATGHDYQITYTFNSDNTKCTADAVCSHDASHKLSETVDTAYEVITAPTCIAFGTGRYTATFTNLELGSTSKDVQIDKTAHNNSSDWSSDATNHWHACLTPGCEAKADVAAHYGGTATETEGAHCEACDYVYTEPTGHTHSMTAHPAVAPTCTEAGNSLYYHCSGCNKYFSDEEGNNEIAENSWVIAALGHTFDSTTHYCTRSGCGALDPLYCEITFTTTTDAGWGNQMGIAGTFTSWGANPLPMTLNGSTWSVKVVLKKNEQVEYKLVKLDYGTTTINTWSSKDNYKYTPSTNASVSVEW